MEAGRSSLISLRLWMSSSLSNSIDAVNELNEKWIRVEVDQIDNNVILKIIDSGKGIDESIQDKIFEDFFSTKDIGKGLGLGLSTSQSLLKEINGEITYNTESKNTEFIVKFPILRS